MKQCVVCLCLFISASGVTCRGNTSVASSQWREPFLGTLFLGALLFEILSATIIAFTLELLDKVDLLRAILW